MPSQQTDEPCSQDHHRKRYGKKEDRDKSGGGQCVHIGIFEGAFADTDDRLNHDRQHSRLDPKKQRLHQGRVLEAGIEHTQHQDAQKARQHK